MIDETKALIEPQLVGFEAPATVAGKSVPEAMADATLRGLEQVYRIIDQPLRVDEEGLLCDQKQQRLIVDATLGVARIFVRAAESEFRARHDDVLDKLLAMIEAEKVKKDG